MLATDIPTSGELLTAFRTDEDKLRRSSAVKLSVLTMEEVVNGIVSIAALLSVRRKLETEIILVSIISSNETFSRPLSKSRLKDKMRGGVESMEWSETARAVSFDIPSSWLPLGSEVAPAGMER